VETFIARYRPAVTAVLNGFDRLVFRGTLLPLVMERGMHTLLARVGVRLLDFKHYALATSEAVKHAALKEAVTQERPIRYLQSAHTDKEALARRLLAEHPIDRGLICAFRTVEPCMSFEYHRSANPAERGLRLRPRKCLHIYKYYLHPVFGFLHARLQTWFPFNVQICLNGREWLASQLARQGRTDFARHANCFTALGDPALAQRLMDRQLTIAWKGALDRIARALNPLHRRIFRAWPLTYYWSAYQSEWATDLLFRDPQVLAPLYPALVRHAMLHFQSPDVMRFLGRKGVHGRFQGELTSSLKRRVEGVRVKHWVAGNSIKMYDKAGSVLRIETTIAKTAPFKVFRPLDPSRSRRRQLAWRPLRKGIADLHRRAQVSQRANEPTSRPWPPWTIARRCVICSTKSPDPSRTAAGASAPCASAIPRTWPSSPRSAAGSLRPPAFATATSAASSLPAPRLPLAPPRPASRASSASSAPTASSRRSRRPIAIG
jgi:hypothetical protein